MSATRSGRASLGISSLPPQPSAFQPIAPSPSTGSPVPPRLSFRIPEDETRSPVPQLPAKTDTIPVDADDTDPYSTTYANFEGIKPFLTAFYKEKEQPKPKVETQDVETRDQEFNKIVERVIDTFKGKEGARKKKDAVKSRAKEYFDTHPKINYRDLETILQAAAASV
jgi:hypothetical protein